VKVHLDPHTGRTVTPDQVPAYLLHPSNAGRVVQLVPVLAFSPPAATGVDGEHPGGAATTSGVSPHHRASNARWS